MSVRCSDSLNYCKDSCWHFGPASGAQERAREKTELPPRSQSWVCGESKELCLVPAPIRAGNVKSLMCLGGSRIQALEAAG